ncbi:MFS transporter, DHA1 family, bicyclomycin/chloramphenicol resistance protein [Pseudooceanicola antarcticus]|uniref:Bcr/CflA family efflux transporter n=1 Tax=Pseudooceanicola antarcticus TaxID=1247613 RepID=A0A285II35_9RHOB|nr:multidrug effflux MFS transporter [Pseudooceanicola antarcticus]PJE29101.1 Bcr/CflA family drug resistance efflux transporter [Pseudooceanicola antarcticus]SNY46736.1 MFS transporter, DHA1 family, bicyclomycin/chloramphenicol resistance protein [Pseudooceanicola antarcticus]
MTQTKPRRYLDRSTPPHLSTLILLAGIGAMTMNVFLPSLPKIADYFAVDYKVVQLSVAGYLAASGFLQLFVGPFADRYGRRPLLLWGLGIFVLATIGCLLAPNFATFMVFRILQASVATSMALSRAVVRDINTPDRAAAMMGYVTMGMSMVPMFAPVLGGVLDEFFGWQASFWLLLASGLVIFWITWADLGETAAPSDLSILRQFGEYPELLTSPRFWGYSMAAATSSGAFFAYIGGGPFVATSVFGLSPAQFGMFNAAAGIGYFIGNWFTGLYASRVGMNRMILSGGLIVTLGMLLSLLCALADFGGPYAFFGAMIFVGFGNGMTIPSANAGMLSVRPHLAGTAAGLGGAIMIGGGAALSALAGSLLAPGTGAFPLIWLMLVCGIASVCCILAVMRRERRLGVA